MPRRTDAAVVSAANPWTGSRSATRWPIVFMIRQPPTAVPSDSADADTTMTQTGTSTLGMTLAEKRARVMIPIVFCASLDPWANAMYAADRTCARRKPRVARRRSARRKIQYRAIMSANAAAKPMIGERDQGQEDLAADPADLERPGPRGDDRGPEQAADEGVAARARQARGAR